MSRRHVFAATSVATALIAGVTAAGLSRKAHTTVLPALVGSSSPHEQAVRQGLELALDALSAAPDATPIELEFLDAQGSVETALAHLRALEARNTRMVVDFTGADLVLGCASHLRTSPLVVVSTDADPRLAARCGERFFRVAPWSGGLARELADWVRDLRIDRVVLVVPDNDDGRVLREAFVSARGGLGDENVLELADPGAQAAWVAMRARELDAAAVVLLTPGGLPVLEALHEAGSSALVFTDDLQLGAALGASRARGLLPRLHVAAEEPVRSDARSAVDAAWVKKHGSGTPPPGVYLGWDALTVVVQAMRGGGDDLDKMLLALRSTHLIGASGELRFQSDGERRPGPARRRGYTPEGVLVPWSYPVPEGVR